MFRRHSWAANFHHKDGHTEPIAFRRPGDGPIARQTVGGAVSVFIEYAPGFSDEIAFTTKRHIVLRFFLKIYLIELARLSEAFKKSNISPHLLAAYQS